MASKFKISKRQGTVLRQLSPRKNVRQPYKQKLQTYIKTRTEQNDDQTQIRRKIKFRVSIKYILLDFVTSEL